MMKIIKKYVLLLGITCTAFLFSGCCFNQSKVLIQNADFVAQNMTLSYEGDSVFYQELRGALSERGIKVLKYNVQTQKIIDEKKHITKTEETKKQVEGLIDVVVGGTLILSVNGSTRSDVTCLTTLSQIYVHNVVVEITDLDTKEVVFSIKASGFPEPCGYCRQTVYENIAENIHKFLLKTRL